MPQKNSPKQRLDMLMVSRGLAESREQAKRLILAGSVIIKGYDLLKPGLMVDSQVIVNIKVRERFVSRGGLKLEAALEAFDLKLLDLVCVDVGASTGGFTDCMLQNGAKRVFSVDVGQSQMHERVRLDSRVTLLEHTNARHLEREMFDVQPVFAAVDVSFISILRITEPLLDVLRPMGRAVFLIKPQFEAGRKTVSRGRGVIRDSAIHREVLKTVLQELREQGWHPWGLIASPIAGGSGNREFLCYAETDAPADGTVHVNIDIDDVI